MTDAHRSESTTHRHNGNGSARPHGVSDARFAITIFSDWFAKSLTTKTVSLTDLRDMTLTTVAANKQDLPWLKLAKFGDKRSKKDSLRNDNNVEVIVGIETDYDGEKVSFDEAVAIVKQSRLTALLYTSPSHSATKPRWRVILPTSRPLPPEERSQLVARVNGIFGGILSTESFTLSQSYYYGYIRGNGDHRAEIVEGDDFIDERADLDSIARGKPAANSGAGTRTNDTTAGSFTIERIEADDPRLANLSDDWIELGTKGTGPHSIASMAKKPGGDRSHAVFAFVCECVRQGIDDNVIASILMHWTIGQHVRDQSNVERAISRNINNAKEKVKDSKLFFMNERYCVLPIGGKTRVATWVNDPEFPGHRTIAMFSSLSDFKLLKDKYRHSYQKMDASGQTETLSVKLGTWWVGNTGRRQFDGGMKFVPTCDDDVVNGNTLNLWQGFKVAARKPEGKSGAKGCQLFLDHACKIICSGDAKHYDYLINREAFIAQRRTRSEIAVGLRTEAEGTGKGLYSRTINYLYGIHAMEIQNPDHVVGKHNPHLEKILRLTADEALFAMNPLHRNALYNLITEPRITIEPKFVNAYPADNYLNVDVISNAEHFLPVSGYARRFFVPTVSQERANDHAYFRAILNQLSDGGYEALLYHLLHEVDIRDFNVREVPKTAALREQAAYSRKGVDLLVEIACNRAIAPWQKADDPGFSVSTGYNRREGFDYFIDNHSDYQLKSLGWLKVKRLLSKNWGCLTGEAARTQNQGRRSRGIRWPNLADLRAMFTAKYGTQDWTTDATEWVGDDDEM